MQYSYLTIDGHIVWSSENPKVIDQTKLPITKESAEQPVPYICYRTPDDHYYFMANNRADSIYPLDVRDAVHSQGYLLFLLFTDRLWIYISVNSPDKLVEYSRMTTDLSKIAELGGARIFDPTKHKPYLLRPEDTTPVYM